MKKMLAWILSVVILAGCATQPHPHHAARISIIQSKSKVVYLADHHFIQCVTYLKNNAADHKFKEFKVRFELLDPALKKAVKAPLQEIDIKPQPENETTRRINQGKPVGLGASTVLTKPFSATKLKSLVSKGKIKVKVVGAKGKVITSGAIRHFAQR